MHTSQHLSCAARQTPPRCPSCGKALPTTSCPCSFAYSQKHCRQRWLEIVIEIELTYSTAARSWALAAAPGQHHEHRWIYISLLIPHMCPSNKLNVLRPLTMRNGDHMNIDHVDAKSSPKGISFKNVQKLMTETCKLRDLAPGYYFLCRSSVIVLLLLLL